MVVPTGGLLRLPGAQNWHPDELTMKNSPSLLVMRKFGPSWVTNSMLTALAKSLSALTVSLVNVAKVCKRSRLHVTKCPYPLNSQHKRDDRHHRDYIAEATITVAFTFTINPLLSLSLTPQRGSFPSFRFVSRHRSTRAMVGRFGHLEGTAAPHLTYHSNDAMLSLTNLSMLEESLTTQYKWLSDPHFDASANGVRRVASSPYCNKRRGLALFTAEAPQLSSQMSGVGTMNDADLLWR